MGVNHATCRYIRTLLLVIYVTHVMFHNLLQHHQVYNAEHILYTSDANVF